MVRKENMKKATSIILTGSLPLILGAAVILGWYGHISMLIPVMPGGVNMVFNTALCFVLAGFAVLMAQLPAQPSKYSNIIIGVALILIAGLTICQDIFHFSLGIDELFMKVWLHDQSSFQGRMGGDTSTAFILAGVTFILLPFSKKKWIATLVQALIFCVFLLGISALLGYLLKIEFLYRWSRYTWMSVHTAVGLTVLALGLWSLWSRSEGYEILYNGKEDKKILLFSCIILFSIALLAGLSGFAIAVQYENMSVNDSFNQQLAIVLPIMLLAIIMGMVLLYKQMTHLIHKAIHSERHAKITDVLLQANEERLNAIIDHATVGMAIASRDGKWIKVNPALCKLLAYKHDELLKVGFQAIASNENTSGDLEIIQQMLANEITDHQSERLHLQKNGAAIWLSVHFSILHSANKEPLCFIVQVQNITSQKAAENKLNYIAYHDQLTGLPNRAQLEPVFNKAIATAQRHRQKLGVLLLNLDHFKEINDRLGQDNGDLLLKAVAERLSTCVRGADIIARLGGDEFVLILTEVITFENIVTVVDRIYLALSEPIVIKGKKATVTASIGISCYPFDGEDAPMLLKNAGLALKYAKANGRKTHQFYSAMA